MNILSKIANAVKNHQKDIFLGFCIILISVIGFDLGRMNASRQILDKTTGQADINKAYPKNTTLSPIQNKVKPSPSQSQDLRVVASKASSSKKYHYSWCVSGKRITQKNQLWFANEILAQKAGYTLAANCQ